MKNNKKIGIPAWSLGDNSFGVQKTYLEYFSKFGKVEILTPDKDIRADLDLVILPGGADTMSDNYNEVPGFTNSMADPYKDYFAKVNLPKYIEQGTPVLGICLGFQHLANHFGLPLIQNIDLAQHGYSKDGDDLLNKCEINPIYKDLLSEIGVNVKSSLSEIKVNSFHHQAVSLDKVMNSKDLLWLLKDKTKIVDYATSTNYIICEAFMHKTLPIFGVQYHPEKASNDFFTSMLIKYILRKTKNVSLVETASTVK